MTARESKGPRLFVSTVRFSFAQKPGGTASLSPSDSHYIRDVLRLQINDCLELGDAESGVVALARIAELEPNVSVTVESILEASDANGPHTTLLCALLKGQKNDLVCDWATELGCSRIIFWQSPRSIVRLDSEKDRLHKETRLSKIAHAAAQQSKQSRPPEVRVTQSLAEALKSMASGTTAESLKLVCSLRADAKPIRAVIDEHPRAAHYLFAIGPEGDFSPDEEKSFSEHGFHYVSLGRRTLRSELAVVTALSSRKAL
jgi:16S rRNA (uracil1498-N3)-methyltransferase